MDKTITSVDIGIKSDKDAYIHIVLQLVIWTMGVGGNLLLFAHQNMSKRKCLTVPMSALSSLDFLLCCILATILFSKPNQWLSINICCMDQILFTRLIVMNYYFILWISRRVGKSFHNVSEKVLGVFHACIVLPLFVSCILDEDNSQTSQGTQETILYCKVFPRKAYGIFTVFIAFGSCFTFVGIITMKKYIMKNTLTSEENGRIGKTTQTKGNRLQTFVTLQTERDGRRFAIHLNVNISAWQGNVHIAFGVIYQTLFSGIVLCNALKDSGIHNIELRKGLTHNIILMLVFLLYDCATPVLYLLFDKTFRNFIAKCITPYNRIEHSTGYIISAIDSERGY